MVKKAGVVAIDSNVFIIDLRYRNDIHFDINQRFLKSVYSSGAGVTSLINLLEIIGILSFNLNERQLSEFYTYFPRRYNVDVIPFLTQNSHLPELGIRRLLEIMAMKASFGDALVMGSLESYIPHASYFVTWDKEHFEGKIGLKVLTPAEFLERHG